MNDIDDIKQKAYDLAENISQHPIAIRLLFQKYLVARRPFP